MGKIQSKQVEELQKRWKGGPCEHLELAKEYMAGSGTGDYACLACGQCRWGSDWADKERRKKMREDSVNESDI